MNQRTCETICLHFVSWEKLRFRLGLFERSGTLSKAVWVVETGSQRQTEPVCSPRGLSGQRIKHCQAPKEKRFARSAEKLSAPLSLVGHGGVVRTNCQITHTHTHKFTQTHIHMHTHTALHYSQVNTSHILWPKEQLGSQTSSNLVLNSTAETKISVVFTKVGPRCFLKSLSTTSESSLQSALFAVLEWNAWFKLEMERKTNWRWGDAGNGTRVGTSVWISGQVLLWRPERGDGRWQAWHRAIRHASGSLHYIAGRAVELCSTCTAL